MMLAIRAPPGSTLERPSEVQIKEMHALAMNKREEFRNMTNDLGESTNCTMRD
jgi:hypothetical protein